MRSEGNHSCKGEKEKKAIPNNQSKGYPHSSGYRINMWN